MVPYRAAFFQEIWNMFISKRRRSVRVVSVWLLLVLLSAVMPGCAQPARADIPTASDSQPTAPAPTGAAPAAATNAPPASDDPHEMALAYSQCIRDNGLPEFPDPQPDGRFMITRGMGFSMGDPRYLAAQEACQQLRPEGFGTAGMGPGGMGHGGMDEETLLRFAQCMRDNGVPNFPDPNPGGGPMVIGSDSGLNPHSPAFQLALVICRVAMIGGSP
jgi:hypothetical protein